MSDRARSVLLTLLLVVSSFSAAGVGAATPTSSPTTFHVTQSDQCYEITPVGNGSTSVEEFYNYRAPGPDYLYGSYGDGSQEIQENQVSHVFVYRGSQGLSLVMLHDDLNRSQGGAITFNISGLPQDHQWVVEDDDYEGRDDNFHYDGTNAKIDWMWASNRTDGAVVRGLENDFSAVTIDPAFGEESWAYQERTKDGEPAPWPFATNDTSWQLQSGDGEEVPLDKSQSLNVSKGSCPDTTDPEAALSASPNPATEGESVTLDASASEDDQGGTGIAEYRWDFDGDGQADRTTANAVVEHAYDSAGTYNASVTVVDGNGNTDEATVALEVEPADSPDPTVTVSAPDSVNVSETFEVSASASDESKVESYEWDFGNTTESGSTVTHSYAEAGERTVTLTWTETDGEVHTSTATIDVVAEQPITYLNATAVKVTGTFEAVDLTYGFYTSDGYGQSRYVAEKVSGTTVVTVPEDEGVNGTVVNLAGVYENFPEGEPVSQKRNPRLDYYAETIEPRPVDISVENVTRTGDGTYDVTFGYTNPNEEVLNISNSTFSGNVTGTAPTTFESGENTATVTWTPENDSERATWTLNRSRFDQSTVTASTPPASEFGDGSDTTAPDAALTATPSSGSVNTTEFVFEANASEDNRGIAAYHWDLDADGEFETTTDGPRTATTYSEPGPREVSVTVEDAAGNTDTASTNISVDELQSERDIEFVNATAVEVTGEFDEVALRTTYFTERGAETATHVYDENISGTTILSAPDEGVWGPVARSAAAFENASNSGPALTAENPDYGTQIAAVRPEAVSTFVADAEKVSNGTYEVTFGYENPNDAAMIGASAFTAGNTSATPPTTFEPGRHTFTVTWTPESDDANLVWESDFSNFGYGASTATSPTPSQIDAGEMAPTAALTADPTTVAPGEAVAFDASASSDPESEDLTYRWDFDGDDAPEKTTENATLTRSFSETGTHHVTVTVVDASGQTDAATESVTVREQSSDSPPTAKLTAPDSGSMSQLFYQFDASASTDDEGIAEYRWDLNGDGTVEWVDDSTTSLKPYTLFEEPGTYEATVTVVDTAGQTDTATVEYTLKKVVPDAAITASSTTVEVGENVTFEATDFNEKPDTLAHVCWEVGDETGPEATTWTTSFEETGDKTVELVLRDRAGYENVVKKTITVTAADSGNGDDGGNSGDDGDSGDSNPDDSNPGEGGLSDGDNGGSTGGGLPSESPADSGGENGNDANDGRTDETVSAPLNATDGQVGTVTLHSSGNSEPEIDATDAAPRNVEAPTAEGEGFAALSYLTISEADRATFTVSKSLLDASNATPEDVTLFRHENGTWTAVETATVGTTDDAYRLGANVSDGTYAVGIGRPATSVTDLSVGSQRVEPGESVTATATVENTGRADDTREVVLTVGGEAVATKTISVEAGATREVTFTRTLDSGGVYQISVGDATAEVVVKGIETTTTGESGGIETSTRTATSTSDGSIPGFGVGVTLVALLAAALVALRRN